MLGRGVEGSNLGIISLYESAQYLGTDLSSGKSESFLKASHRPPELIKKECSFHQLPGGPWEDPKSTKKYAEEWRKPNMSF